MTRDEVFRAMQEEAEQAERDFYEQQERAAEEFDRRRSELERLDAEFIDAMNKRARLGMFKTIR